ncbi:MAG TPA: 50S ribosomal protein L32e [Thermoplasmata archaeon]|nr:50S ribosomal protein L32e [Thermoplasmata archaeon]
MADETPVVTETSEEAPRKEPQPKAAAPRRRAKTTPKETPAATPAETPEKAETKAKSEEPRAPRRADLSPEVRALMRSRDEIDRRRPLFGRQARYRYYRIGRDMAWRRPRGLQSKQRRHYGYRPRIVRVGYRSPARVRGLVPSGFRPMLVRTDADLKRLDAKVEAAVIARTVGTRRRLVLEETARRLGIRVLNPIVTSEREG